MLACAPGSVFRFGRFEWLFSAERLWPFVAQRLRVIAPAATRCLLCNDDALRSAARNATTFDAALVAGSSANNARALRADDVRRRFVLLPTALRPVKAPHFVLDAFSQRFAAADAPLLLVVGPVRNDAFAQSCQFASAHASPLKRHAAVLNALSRHRNVYYCGTVAIELVEALMHSRFVRVVARAFFARRR